MTNKEWMVTLTAEEFYDAMEWLTHVYSKWLDKEHEHNKTDISKT